MFHKIWIHLEIAGLQYGANQLEANAQHLADSVKAELGALKSSPSISNINAAVEKRAGPILGRLIKGELETLEAEGGSELAKNLPALFARVAAGLRAKATELEKSIA